MLPSRLGLKGTTRFGVQLWSSAARFPMREGSLWRSSFLGGGTDRWRKTDRRWTVVWRRAVSSLAAEFGGDVEIPVTCPGCGIRLQQRDQHKPGFFRIPKPPTHSQPLEVESARLDNQFGGSSLQTETHEEAEVSASDEKESSEADEVTSVMSQSWEIVPQTSESEAAAVVCERCFSLRNYGRLKSQEAEALVPYFSVETALKPKIAKTKGKKVVIVCVVDVFDFAGSLPLEELKSLMPTSKQLPDFLDFIFVCNKVDLIDKKYLTRGALEVWVRTSLKAAGLLFARSVHFISSQTMLGVRDLMVGIRREVGRNTDCYIIGTQNAGKSSMLNALRKLVHSNHDKRPVTTAALPGTTLGFVHVSDFPVPKSCRVFDTPGLRQASLITSRLTMNELKLVQPKRPVKPRTYRFGPGSSLLIGGLVRLDLNQMEGATLYATVWMSDAMICFLGRTEKIQEKLEKHRGQTLRPPISTDPELQSAQELVPQAISLRGSSWKNSTTDICIAGWAPPLEAETLVLLAEGMGWVAIGCEGSAEFTVWTLPGIQVTARPALLLRYAKSFQRPGFSDTVKSGGLRT